MNLTVIDKILQHVCNKTGLQPETKRTSHTRRRGDRALAAVLLTICLLVMTACGGTKTAGQENNTGSGDGAVAEVLADVNEIPEDGIITKEQFATVAGEDKQIQFTGEENGISYVWTFDAKQIQNPQDQNLKISFATEGLDDIKTAANNANDALKMTMEGQGLICVPTLTVTLPVSWQSDTGLLLKEQDGQLAKMSDVTIESQGTDAAQQSGQAAEQVQQSNQATDAAQQDSQAASAAPGAGTTVLTMTVTSLDGDCYVVGGITGSQNKGAAAANEGNADIAAGGETVSGDAASGNPATGNTASGSTASGDSGTANASGGSQDDGNASGDVKNDDVKNGDIASGNGNSGDTGSGNAGSSAGGSESGGHTCTISISCSTILNNMDNLTAGKEEFVPSDGWILPATTVEFNEGDSVHDVLKAVCKDNGIHMESTYTPMYDSAYVEGINQLYEFDCGELSGWMYNVNGWFPNYGCSKYTVSDGDVINWVYTCDLGKDVGDNSMY